MVITANVVAVVAILTGLAGVVLTNRSQRVLADSQYFRDHRTAAYLRLLQAVNIQILLIAEAYELPPGAESSVMAAAAGPTSESETEFTASLLAYGSLQVFDLYTSLDSQTREFAGILRRVRDQHGKAPELVPGVRSLPGVNDADARWQATLLATVNAVGPSWSSGRPCAGGSGLLYGAFAAGIRTTISRAWSASSCTTIPGRPRLRSLGPARVTPGK